MRSAFEVVSRIFRSIPLSVAAANAMDLAYAEGVGHPEYHAADFGADQPQKVAENLAGLYAADTAANILAAYQYGVDRDGKVTEVSYVRCLEAIRGASLDATEKFIVKNAANATWRAGQPFRDITTKPLNRIERDVNMQFNLLPGDEEDKDLVQVQKGAEIILDAIAKENS